jgi:hypothetical protein
MKAKVSITKTIEVEIPDELEKYTWEGTWQHTPDEKIDRDIAKVSAIVGLPFAADVTDGEECFYSVYTMDGRAIFEG